MKNYNYYLKWTLLFFCVSFQAVSQNTAAKEINRLEKLAAKVKTMTKGQGLEWDRVLQLSQTLTTDSNSMNGSGPGNSVFSEFRQTSN